MELGYLQKLSYLLERVNQRQESKDFTIVFGLNNNVYIGKFVPKTEGSKIVYKDKEINVRQSEQYKKFFEPFFNDSDFFKIVNCSSHYDSLNYYLLLKTMLEKYPIEFGEKLPPYIYNVKSLNKSVYLKLDIMEIPKHTKFDFVSVMPDVKTY
ncbi:hypothetical protein [Staphylococcus simulans]|uniref:hypothetical protein n=1 Tax=Staphylococcus simulans TaxID=1286 RepID=UPI000E6A150F|nr:hypothetical protein [Staphylococcus simulans]RIN56342.1 hypothetical protein BU029_00595 [Staphylococcus simulans]UXR49577.1 hypothetical protein MUA28_10525 [Staphylococcus simulans]